METEILVGMGNFEVRKEGFMLLCVGIGSCISTMIFDPLNKVYGMAHVMLPFRQNADTSNPNKFADVCIPNMIKDILYLGGERRNLVAKIAGGAHMFPSLKNDVLSINVKNAEAVREVLSREKIRIIAEDIGGNIGRTIKLNTSTGRISVLMRSTGEEKEL